MKKTLVLTDVEVIALESLLENYLQETDNKENKKYYKKLLNKIRKV